MGKLPEDKNTPIPWDMLNDCLDRKEALAAALGKMGGHALHLLGMIDHYISNPEQLRQLAVQMVNDYREECDKLWPPKEDSGANDHS